MSDSPFEAQVGRTLQEVLRRTHLSTPAELGTVVAEEARGLGADSLVVYLVDYEQRLLSPVPAPDAEGREPLPVLGTVAGKAFTSTSILDIQSDRGRGRRLWVPLIDGTERLGVLDVTFPDQSGPVPAALLTVAERYAHLIAILLATKSLYSDVFESIRRRRPMTVASELLWGLVPPLVLASDDFVLSALLEPCYDNGGTRSTTRSTTACCISPSSTPWDMAWPPPVRRPSRCRCTATAGTSAAGRRRPTPR